MPQSVVLAIDLGTSGSRVIAFSQEAHMVAQAYFEFKSLFPKPGWVEQDPTVLWHTTLKALRRVIAQVGARHVMCIGITNQRETTILWDQKTGKPIGNAIVWQDRRTEDLCRRLKKREAYIRRRTGLLLDPYFSATKIRWMLDHISGLRQKVARGEICFGTPDAWLLWNLTGGKVFATEPSNACRTLLFDIHQMAYSSSLLRFFGIPAGLRLPEVRDSDAPFGATLKTMTGRAIPITAILGDQQSALFAHGAWQPGILKNTYGTGLFLLTNTQNRVVHSKTLLSTVAWKIQGKTHYALEGSVLVGGSVFNWLRDHLGILRSYKDIEPICRSLPDNEGVYFVPALQGLGAPYWDASAKGLIIGLTRKTSRENIVRAAQESLAYQSRDLIEAMQEALGRKIRLLRVDGGGTISDFLMQFQADLLGIPVQRPRILETTALGAAALAGLGVGFWTRRGFKRLIRIDKTYRPRLSPGEREKRYRGWQNAIQKILN